MGALKIDEVMARWGDIAPALAAPGTQADCDALIESLNVVLDAGGADESHPLASLAMTIGDLIEAWESAQYGDPGAASGVEVLRHLMDEHGLVQTDLADEIGSQGVVSEVLSGKRPLNVRQMRALGDRFGVPASVFL